MSEKNILLEIKQFSLSYAGTPALSDISCTIPAGIFTGIAGCSGSGKTSLLAAIAGTLPPSAAVSGQLFWYGCSLHDNKRCRGKLLGSSIAVLPQQAAASLYPLADAGSQLRLVQRLHGGGSDSELCSLLNRLGLDNPRQLLRKRPAELSGGQARRVCLAMCLLQRPELLLADEPTAGLDAIACGHVLDELQLLQKECGTAILLTSHDLGFLSACCSKFIIMEQGHVAEQGDVSILSSPQHPCTKNLLAAVPVLYKENEDHHAPDK